MPRYFIEVAYNGAAYSGFQIQQNANTIQAEVEKALLIYFKSHFSLTGSSRTDAGVHARQNFFHVDTDINIEEESNSYHLNAILPEDIVINGITMVKDEAHCRFDAISRAYKYYIYQKKDPFSSDRAYFFPYKLDIELMNEAASIIKSTLDFTSFSKKNTQVNNFMCHIIESKWIQNGDTYIYHVISNRFLRGMVKGLAGTMLQVGTHKISLEAFRHIIISRDCTLANFSVPAHALFLEEVVYPK
jgi:tRNA pseudouridine38-40 synthase